MGKLSPSAIIIGDVATLRAHCRGTRLRHMVAVVETVKARLDHVPCPLTQVDLDLELAASSLAALFLLAAGRSQVRVTFRVCVRGISGASERILWDAGPCGEVRVLPAQGLDFGVSEYVDLLIREGALHSIGVVAQTIILRVVLLAFLAGWHEVR